MDFFSKKKKHVYHPVSAKIIIRSNQQSIFQNLLFNQKNRFSVTPWWQLVACSITGLVFWLCICYTMRYTLKLLLMYKGWMYETRGKGSKVSLTTRVWGVATKILSNWNTPGLYSFQGSLPRLPLPSVRDTTQRVCTFFFLTFKQNI